MVHVGLSNLLLEWAVHVKYFTLLLLQLLGVILYMLLKACLLKRDTYSTSPFHIFPNIFLMSWLFSKGLVLLSTVISVMSLPRIYRDFFT